MHAHASVQHLIQQAEAYAERRKQKDQRPEWLKHFILETAELFDPVTDRARVGYDCRFDEDHWQVMVYLGDAEIFGGKHDGQRTRIAFEFDITQFLTSFQSVDSIIYRTINPEAEFSEDDCNMIEVTGWINHDGGRDQITVGILSKPPQEAGPALRMMPGGEIQLI